MFLQAFLIHGVIISTPSANASATKQLVGTTGSYPFDITLDSAGNIFTANFTSNNVTKFTKSGSSYTAAIFGTTGAGPSAITIDSAGNIYTANATASNVTKITPAGVATTFGSTGSGSKPYDITIDSSGNIYTANNGTNNITKITPAGVVTANWASLGASTTPYAITFDSTSGNLYTANYGNNTVSKVTTAGVVTNFGSTGTKPIDITTDSSGNVFTVNNGSNDVSKITSAGVSTQSWAGTGLAPFGIVADSSGNIYVTNYSDFSVSKITPLGVAAAYGSTGQGPIKIALDSVGTAYVVNRLDNTVTKLIPNFTLTVTSDANATISPSTSTTIALGSTPTYTITPRAGYQIVSITVDGVPVTPTTGTLLTKFALTYTFPSIQADHTIAATYRATPVYRAITVTPPTNGTISPGTSTSILNGTTPTYTITPASGYQVELVTVNGVGVVTSPTTPSTSVITYTFPAITANNVIAATFSEISNSSGYTNMVATTNNGTITPATSTGISTPSTIEYTFTPDSGYRVTDVLVDGVSVTPTTGTLPSTAAVTYNVASGTADHTIDAVFTAYNPCVFTSTHSVGTKDWNVATEDMSTAAWTTNNNGVCSDGNNPTLYVFHRYIGPDFDSGWVNPFGSVPLTASYSSAGWSGLTIDTAKTVLFNYVTANGGSWVWGENYTWSVAFRDTNTLPANATDTHDVVCASGSIGSNSNGCTDPDGSPLESGTGFATFTASFSRAQQVPLSLTLTPTSKTGSPYSSVTTFTPAGGSGTGTLTYSIDPSSTAADCSLNSSSNPESVTATSTGTCVINLVKAADSTYEETSTVTTFTFLYQPFTFVLSPSSKTGSPFIATISVSTTGGSGGSLTYSINSADSSAASCTLDDSTNPTTITATSIGVCAVVVTNGSESGVEIFTFAPSEPTITSISPSSGNTAGGTSITITGTNFAAGATVSVGGAPCASVVVVSATSITCTTPAGSAGAKDVVVTNSDTGAATSTGGFTYVTPISSPTIGSISPVSGSTAGTTSITITGTNFVSGATVTVGGNACTSVVVVSATSITCTTPAGSAGAKDVVVTNSDTGAATSTGGFTYVTPIGVVRITSISPKKGPIKGGTEVTITGAGFSNAAKVTVRGVSAVIIKRTGSTKITIRTPKNAKGAASIVVTNPDTGFATFNGFTYTAEHDSEGKS